MENLPDTKDASTPGLEGEIVVFLGRCFKRWRLAACVAFTIGFATAAGSLLMDNQYRSTTKFVLRSTQAGLGGSLGTIASLAGVGSAANGNDPSAYFAEIVQSVEMGRALLEREWTIHSDENERAPEITLGDLWDRAPDTTASNWQAKEFEVLLKRLKKGYVSVEKDIETGVITLSTRFEDPRVAFDVNGFILDRMNDVFVTRLKSSAGENRKFIGRRLVEVKSDLANAEEALRSFLDQNRVRSGPELQMREARLQRDVQVNQEVYLQLVKQFELAKIDEAKDVPVLDVIDRGLQPIKKDGPPRSLISLGGLVMGCILGFFGAGLWDVYSADRAGFFRKALEWVLRGFEGKSS